MSADDLAARLRDREWRLDNLYKIRDEAGRAVAFRRNWVQRAFYERIWYFNVILKARQLGFSTFILLYSHLNN